MLQLEHTVGGSAVAIELADGKSLRFTPEPEGPALGPETERGTPFGAPDIGPAPADMGPTFLPLDASLRAAAFWIACMLGEAFDREAAEALLSGAIGCSRRKLAARGEGWY